MVYSSSPSQSSCASAGRIYVFLLDIMFLSSCSRHRLRLASSVQAASCWLPVVIKNSYSWTFHFFSTCDIYMYVYLILQFICTYYLYVHTSICIYDIQYMYRERVLQAMWEYGRRVQVQKEDPGCWLVSDFAERIWHDITRDVEHPRKITGYTT